MATAKKQASTSNTKQGLPTAAQFIKALTSLKTSPPVPNGKYFRGEDAANKILGVRMASIFSLAKEFVAMPLEEIEKLLGNDYYEVRMGAVSIMDFQARDKKITPEQRKALYDLYMKRHDRINNWDLVDRSAPYVVGGYLFDKDRKPLYKLSKSKNMLERRTAIVATYFFIRQNDTADTFAIAELLVHDPHELINMAVGGWVREAGKKDKQRLLDFLNKFADTMPRITLRYAIEKLSPQEKAGFMKRGK